MKTENQDEYKTIGWILDHSDEGFFFLVASEQAQRGVVSRYANASVAVLDYKKTQSRYTFLELEQFVGDNPNAKAYFLQNFQLAVRDGGDIERFNFSRDMLARLEKNFIFCVTQRADDMLAKGADDFYSFIKFRLYFNEETIEEPDENDFPLLKFDLSTGVELPDTDYALPVPRLLSQAITLTTRAEQLQKEFRYKDALALLQRVMEIRERLLGKEHPDTASAYYRIAYVSFDAAHYQEALEWALKAKSIREDVFGVENPYTADTYGLIGNAYFLLNDYNEALEWVQRALSIREKALGTEHPDTARSYNNIATIYNNQGDYTKALEWHYKALAIREKALGTEHPDTAGSYNNIATVYNNQGDYTKALEWCQKALGILERVLGKGHPKTIAVNNNIKKIKRKLAAAK